MFIEIMYKTFSLVLIISGIPLLLGALSGLLISILQAATSVQEQTSVYLVKLAALVLSLFLFGAWFVKELLNLITQCLRALAQVNM